MGATHHTAAVPAPGNSMGHFLREAFQPELWTFPPGWQIRKFVLLHQTFSTEANLMNISFPDCDVDLKRERGGKYSLKPELPKYIIQNFGSI